uniref:non-specific serine/threonine protein kinase n=1 Tax=Kalanchoe fedtschenkoi TaxID=63787 RepID=A0A7N0VKW9_KALFE
MRIKHADVGRKRQLHQVKTIEVLPCADSLSFNFTSFSPNSRDINFSGDAFASDSVLQITKNQIYAALTDSVGRAIYAQPVSLWDAKTQTLTDFTTHFSFIISAKNQTDYGDGLAFFLAPVNSTIPPNSTGGQLGLVNRQTSSNSSENQIVAVEFDSFKNIWDPSRDHVGINVNSVVSVANVSWNSSIKDGRTANAWVTYNSTTHNLSVFLTYADNPVFLGNSSLWNIIDLRTALPETVIVGFSAATGTEIEIHNILSWDFYSSLEVATEGSNNETVPAAAGSSNDTELSVGVVVPVAVLVLLGFLWLRWRRKRKLKMNVDEEPDVSMDDEFERGTGPRRFTYADLSRATNNFSEDRKLGEGGFGGVYRGILGDLSTGVAVKRVSKGSKQGKKEYISEVKIISRLRHRNLVQLIGWCHGNGELLLVYEIMPNGSLDSHLFGNKEVLTWELRHKIALGLASALLYLHEEGEQCVVHRDIKSSNVMLDSNFNAKLGDFGLARFVDHELGSQTTVLAGTMGYMAPECYMTGKASKESDVYSFGVVALEITCGRKPVEANAEPTQVRLVEWVWSLYGKGELIEAADRRLSAAYDERELERLMIVGLWCCHPDSTVRPSIRQVISVLNSEAPLPTLPAKLPVPTYAAPAVDISLMLLSSSYTSSYMNYPSDQYTSSAATTDTTATPTSSSQGLLHSLRS